MTTTQRTNYGVREIAEFFKLDDDQDASLREKAAPIIAKTESRSKMVVGGDRSGSL
jgi:hypothetical protein